MADKLDGVMLVVFNYLDQRLTANASLPPETILETPVAGDGGCEDAAAAQGVLRGDEAGSDSGALKGRGGSTGGLQGMEPVARLLKVGRLDRLFNASPPVVFLSNYFLAQDDGGVNRWLGSCW